MPSNKRKLSNWLQTYRDWALPRTDAPESFVLWSGLFTIAAALRRRVVIPKEVLGSWECYPFMYLILMGPPGIRKTTVVKGFSAELLRAIPEIHEGPTTLSSAAMYKRIIESPDASMYLVIEEFSDIFLKSKVGGHDMIEVMNGLFDGKRKIESETYARDTELVESPCLNIVAGVTPDWLFTRMPSVAVGGGFASRAIFIYEEELRQKKISYKKVMRETNFKKIEESLVEDLMEIASMEGEYDMSDEDTDKLEDWYQTYDSKAYSPNLAGYIKRKPTHVLKLAMLLAASTSSELVIKWYHIETAIDILNSIEPNLVKIFSNVGGKNVYSLDMRDIISFIHKQGRVNRATLLGHFRAVAEPSKLRDLIQGCILTQDVFARFEKEDGKTTIVYYSPEVYIATGGDLVEEKSE